MLTPSRQERATKGWQARAGDGQTTMSTQLPTFQDQNGRDWTLPELVRTALYDYGHAHGYLEAKAQERDHERHLEQLRSE